MALILNLSRHPCEGDAVELSRLLLGAVREPRLDVVQVGNLAGQLRDVDPAALEASRARLAFWINIYNALVSHSLRLGPRRRSVLLELRTFNRTSYVVCEQEYSPNDIEHGLLRGNSRPPWQPHRTMRDDDPRLASAPSRLDPRVHFALNCGALSCPAVAAYDADRVDEQLGIATRAYLRTEAKANAERGHVELPGLMRIYRHDFGSREDALRFAATNSPEIANVLGKRPRPRVTYGRFDWSPADAAAGLGS